MFSAGGVSRAIRNCLACPPVSWSCTKTLFAKKRSMPVTSVATLELALAKTTAVDCAGARTNTMNRARSTLKTCLFKLLFPLSVNRFYARSSRCCDEPLSARSGHPCHLFGKHICQQSTRHPTGMKTAAGQFCRQMSSQLDCILIHECGAPVNNGAEVRAVSCVHSPAVSSRTASIFSF